MKHRSRSFSRLGIILVTLALCASFMACRLPTNPSSGAKAITSFQFLGISSVVKINENASPKTINASVPFDTDVSQLVAVFSTTGSSVAYGSVKQVSGVSKNDFSDPLTYTVTASDGTTQDYIVTVTVPGATSSAKAITAFSFVGLSPSVKIDQATNSIAVTVASGTDLRNLVATFTTTGASVKVGSIEQTSGLTANDFTNSVAYRVTALDGKTRDYMVTVTKPGELSSAKALTAFSFVGYNPSVTIDQEAGSVAVTLPYRTDQADITKLVATFSTTGASVKVGETVQVSGTTVNNFSSPVTYTVTAANGTTKDYVVTVTMVKNPAKAITAFSILSPATAGTIDDATKTISVSLPYGSLVASLVASFTTTGASVKVGETVQVSGTTPNNFGSPLTYTVTADDGTSQDYTVTVTVAKSSAKAITAFSIQSPAATGSIDETAKTISVKLPYGSPLTSLVASFTTTGASVKVGQTVQVSGTTPNNFGSPLTYTVMADDGTSQDYVVTATVAKNSAKAITAFSIQSPAATGAIDETAKTVSVKLPYGSPLTSLVASFTTTGASVKIGAAVQASGTTVNNFASPLTYTVTADDGTSQDYTVTVTAAKNSSKAITAFSFIGFNPSVSINETAGTIAVTLPYPADDGDQSGPIDVKQLIATFTTTGNSVAVGATIQESGKTVNDFSAPVIYTVTAADATTRDYTVTVTALKNPAKSITAFSILSPAATGSIDQSAKTISVTLPYGTSSIANLVAIFTTTGASVKVGSTPQTSGTTPNNFSSPLTYTVTAADATSQDYVVTVSVAKNSAKAITAFSIADPAATGLVSEANKTIAISLPYGTNVSCLVANFTTTGASVKVGTTIQVSGTTPNNFGSPVTYTVTAENGMSQDYVVTVTLAQELRQGHHRLLDSKPVGDGYYRRDSQDHRD